MGSSHSLFTQENLRGLYFMLYFLELFSGVSLYTVIIACHYAFSCMYVCVCRCRQSESACAQT